MVVHGHHFWDGSHFLQPVIKKQQTSFEPGITVDTSVSSRVNVTDLKCLFNFLHEIQCSPIMSNKHLEDRWYCILISGVSLCGK